MPADYLINKRIENQFFANQLICGKLRFNFPHLERKTHYEEIN